MTSGKGADITAESVPDQSYLTREAKPEMEVWMMDLCCVTPYYVGPLCAHLGRQNVLARLRSVRYYLDPECFSRMQLRPEPGLVDAVSGLGLPKALRRIGKALECSLNLLALAVRLVRAKPDVIHFHQLPLVQQGLPAERCFMKLAKRLGVKVVHTVHNVLPHDSGDRLRPAFERVYQMADALICHSEHVRERLVTEFRVAPDRTWVIPHGPLFDDLPRRSCAEARQAAGFESDECVVFFQGFLKPYKGVSFLLEAWQKIQAGNDKARLLIGGTGEPSLTTQVLRMATSLGIQRSVRFELRFLPVSELLDLYQSADIVVCPYRAITTSGALMTAVPFGKAIVATTLPAFQELLTDGENAVLVDYGDVEGLAEALTLLIRNPEERNRLAQATASLLKPEARWPAIASKTRQCYESLLQAQRGNATKRTLLAPGRE